MQSAASIFSLSASKPSVLEAFESFRIELDCYHDRRERLIKASRDATNLSKKVIFLLHRTASEAPNHDPAVAKRAALHGYEKLREVRDIFVRIKGELEGDRYWRHRLQISPCLQEYTEALSFAHYLEHGSLITLKQVQETLSDTRGEPSVLMSVSDYLLGVSDLMGELMRYAISGISKRGGLQKASDICRFVRGCKADFELFTPHIPDLRKKQTVTAQSLEKIEDANYAVVVRGSEFDLPQELLDDIVAQAISNFHNDSFGHGDHHRQKRRRSHDGDDADD